MSFPLRRQQMDSWCWAAVAQSIDRYFDSTSRRSQCDIATIVRNRTCCPPQVACDVAESLRFTLTRPEIDNLRQFYERRLPMVRIEAELNNGLPVAARIGWFGGGGHFVVITGFDVDSNGEGLLEIHDPLEIDDARPRPIVVPYRQFAAGYGTIGVWTHTYLLRP